MKLDVNAKDLRKGQFEFCMVKVLQTLARTSEGVFGGESLFRKSSLRKLGQNWARDRKIIKSGVQHIFSVS